MASIRSHLRWKIAASEEAFRKAVSNQFISTTRRDFVDRSKGKLVHFSPFPGHMLCPGVGSGEQHRCSFFPQGTHSTDTEKGNLANKKSHMKRCSIWERQGAMGAHSGTFSLKLGRGPQERLPGPEKRG